MAIIPFFNAVKLNSRDSDFLDRRTGSRGEIFLDRNSNSLRIYNSTQQGGIELARSDLANISNNDFLSKANAAGVGAAGINSFSTISVTDQSNVVAEIANDTLNLVAGSNITITTNPTTDSITISATVPEGGGGGASNSFATITVAGQSNIVADSSTDTLTLVAGSGITITTNAETDTLTITNSSLAGNAFGSIQIAGQSTVVADSSTDTLVLVAGSGISLTTNEGTDTITISSTLSATTFADLPDASAATLTIDKIYLPAITMLRVTNSGASAYRFDQYGSVNNPTIYALNGATIAFNLAASGHPFLIQNGAGVNYNTGLIHVSTAGVVSTGASAQGKDSGTLYWKIPDDASGGFRYQCQAHAPMVGSINVKNFASI